MSEVEEYVKGMSNRSKCFGDEFHQIATLTEMKTFGEGTMLPPQHSFPEYFCRMVKSSNVLHCGPL